MSAQQKPYQLRVNAALYRVECGMALLGDDAEILARAYRIVESQLAAMREMGGRIVLRYGIVGDYDGAYDWMRKEDYDKPEYSLGYHDGGWEGEGYTVVEVRKAEGGEG